MEIEVYNRRLAIRSNAPSEYVKQVAKYVEERIKALEQPGVSPMDTVILACMNIADELLELRSEHADYETTIDRALEILNKVDI